MESLYVLVKASVNQCVYGAVFKIYVKVEIWNSFSNLCTTVSFVILFFFAKGNQQSFITFNFEF